MAMNCINNVASGGIQARKEMYGIGAKVGNVKLPDFKNIRMYTKTEPSMSDEELKEAIAKIARKDAEKGQFHNQTKEYLDLKREYISSASPDRESLVTNSTKQIFANVNLLKSNPEERPKTLLELLMEKKDNKIIAINMNSSEYKACFQGDELSYAEFRDSNGEIVATYGQNGWACILTKAEGIQLNKFAKTYNEAWDNANTVPKHIEGGANIDAYA
jgi:hypothetical protein